MAVWKQGDFGYNARQGRSWYHKPALPWLLRPGSAVPIAGHCQTRTHMQAIPCTASSQLSMTIHTLPLAASGGSLCDTGNSDIGTVEGTALALVALLLHAQTAQV